MFQFQSLPATLSCRTIGDTRVDSLTHESHTHNTTSMKAKKRSRLKKGKHSSAAQNLCDFLQFLISFASSDEKTLLALQLYCFSSLVLLFVQDQNYRYRNEMLRVLRSRSTGFNVTISSQDMTKVSKWTKKDGTL